MNETILEIDGLRVEATVHPPGEKPREVVLVHEASLRLAKGRVLGLIGESGAGKSTIGLAALGYGRGGARLSAGRIRLGGEDIRVAQPGALRAIRGRRVTYVAQSAATAFNPATRLMDQVVEATVWHGLANRTEAERRAVAIFGSLGLPDPERFGRRFPHQASGGQLQRAMTAMALCPLPNLIVFDEPTTALDVTTQIDVLAAIKRTIRDVGVAALYISHDLAVVAQIADEILVLRHGRMVETGPTDRIIRAPREDYTRALLSVRSIARDEAAPTLPLLSVDAVSARYPGSGGDVLSEVSVDLAAGQTLAIVGESGSGKSTLGRVIAGLLPPRLGSVRFEGRTLPHRLEDRTVEDLRQIQLVYQMADAALNPYQTVRTIIGRPLDFYLGMKGAEREARVQDLLAAIELGPEYAGRFPNELSGGQKQRVSIARALAARPKLIICDEVISALDPLVADGILRLLLDLQAREGVAYLFITHDLAAVRSIADSIAIMHRGRVVRSGRKSQVLTGPFDDYTELLLASVPEMRVGWLEEAVARRRIEAAGH